LLPFFEQQAAYDNFLSWLQDPTYYYHVARHKPDQDYLNPQIGVLYCPSDGVRWVSDQHAKLSYRICVGDFPIETNGWNWGHQYIRGPFTTGRFGGTTSISSLVDGTSNTIIMSESIIGDGSRNFKSGTPDRWGGVKAEISNDEGPIACLQFRDTGSKSYKADIDIVTNWWDLKSGRAFSSEVLHSSFFTALPPNSPWCFNNWGFYHLSASSNHTGGVNVALGDASVTFVSDTVNCNTTGTNGQSQSAYASPVDHVFWNRAYAGPSPYGVWGAAGSKAGGESVSL
jgi:hypothetical protein